MDLLYKTLFEIKLLNEYFVTEEDGASLLDEPDHFQRLDRLQEAFALDRETMNRDIEFRFPDTLAEEYERAGFKLLPSYSGCRVLLRVARVTLPDGSEVFKPLFLMPPSQGIFIAMEKKNNLPDTYSNGRLRAATPAVYIFSNEDLGTTRRFPFLVNTVTTFSNTTIYEQGELSTDAGGLLHANYYDGNGNPVLLEIKTAVKDFANENDRMLVPLAFRFSVQHPFPVNQLEAVLKDESDNIIRQLTFTAPDPITNVQLDFTGNAAQLSQFVPFKLTVTGDNGFIYTKQVIFSNTLYSSANWGLIHLKPLVTDAAFNLVAPDGFLVRRRDAAGIWTDAPVFEIPVKSRLAHFRYLNNRGKKLLLEPGLVTYLQPENGALISLKPVSLARNYFPLTDIAGTSTRYLPNPGTGDIKLDRKHRIYFDLYVPEAELFPVQH
ncbi:MAG: hypothetical protein EOO09_03245 [Chitinophagaceae bacterium]|nr:MAG: hypothetical protein EOO09_03245 [Chitinophagaceae bacterium]